MKLFAISLTALRGLL